MNAEDYRPIIFKNVEAENLKHLAKLEDSQLRAPLFFAHWLKPPAPLTIRDKIRIVRFKITNFFRRNTE